LNGTSKDDFEFGKLISPIELILEEIKAPTMLISNDKLAKIQTLIIKSKTLIMKWIGFESVIGCLESILSLVEELLFTNSPVIRVSNESHQKLIELNNALNIEIKKAYAHT
jgi:hypothetical protein